MKPTDARVNPIETGKMLRELRGLKTAAGVSRELGISQSALLAYETGERTPRDEVKVLLAKYYNTSVSSLFYHENDGDG